MNVNDVIAKIERINEIIDNNDATLDIAPRFFDDIITFLEEYRDRLLNLKVG